LQKIGDKVSFKNDNIIITDADGKTKCQCSCYKLFMVFIVGGFTVTTGIIERSKRFGFSIALLTTTFRVYETINFKMEGNTLLRIKQYTNQNGNEIGRKIIINKIENQGHILNVLRDANAKVDVVELQKYIDKLETVNGNSYEIMGIEGIASKVYFNRIFKEFDWKGRQPRVKRDRINLLLDIGYTVLFNYLEAILNIYGFDIYKGNLHKEFYKRKSLVCDIIEPFRPLIDYQVRKVHTLKQVDKWTFSNDNGRYQMDFKNSTEFVAIILKIILEYKESMFEYIQQYYRWFMKDKELEYFPKARLMKNDTN